MPTTSRFQIETLITGSTPKRAPVSRAEDCQRSPRTAKGRRGSANGRRAPWVSPKPSSVTRTGCPLHDDQRLAEGMTGADIQKVIDYNTQVVPTTNQHTWTEQSRSWLQESMQIYLHYIQRAADKGAKSLALQWPPFDTIPELMEDALLKKVMLTIWSRLPSCVDEIYIVYVCIHF